ncbi:FAD-binding oxidoreductase [Ahrensia sp. R2A130]|uniref:FAD-binding oxidoreductase n=1 Tax=Ahrensia sp. R2A130 TaxID=744979 RepID=UPI0001E094C6|nr:FAD-binding oxidoreductase [Ahrensia sp. R2A130]EFL88173.1 putative oxidoreductase protein [Ahrensia sp. R2A130]
MNFLDQLREAVPPHAITDLSDEMAPHLSDWLNRYHGRALAVLKPATTQEAARMVALCQAHRVPVFLQGGNTGLVGGSVPDETGDGVVLSTARMTTIQPADTANRSITAQAGATLSAVKAAADDAGLRLPVALGSEGTAQVGGLIATNAGGSHAMRFGMMRDLVVGLEVVLPDGSVESDLRPLRKNNFGPDLSGIFVGTEGAFGLVTAATLSLVDRPGALVSCLLGLDELAALPDLLARAHERFGAGFERLEFMGKAGITMALKHVPAARQPLEGDCAWTLLLEVAGRDEDKVRVDLLDFLEELFEGGIVGDGTIAESLSQGEAFWLLREAVVEGQRLAGPQLKHDIAVAVSDLPGFIIDMTQRVESRFAGCTVNAFGHAGDGNVHFNISMPAYDTVRDAEISAMIYDGADAMGGTVAAEHGIGRTKRERFRAQASPAKLALLDAMKDSLDPQRLFNPHILFAQNEGTSP